MKKYWFFLLAGILLLSPCAGCAGLYLYDWIYQEIALQQWLNEDKRRLDLFQLYATYPSQAQLREVLLNKLPPGTPEEEIKAFYLANTEGDDQDWSPSKYSDENLVVLTSYAGSRGHGHMLQRMFGKRIVIVFSLNPVDNSLRDITVHIRGDSL